MGHFVHLNNDVDHKYTPRSRCTVSNTFKTRSYQTKKKSIRFPGFSKRQCELSKTREWMEVPILIRLCYVQFCKKSTIVFRRRDFFFMYFFPKHTSEPNFSWYLVCTDWFHIYLSVYYFVAPFWRQCIFLDNGNITV